MRLPIIVIATVILSVLIYTGCRDKLSVAPVGGGIRDWIIYKVPAPIQQDKPHLSYSLGAEGAWVTIYAGKGNFYKVDLRQQKVLDSFKIRGIPNDYRFDFEVQGDNVYILNWDVNEIDKYSLSGDLLERYQTAGKDAIIDAMDAGFHIGRDQSLFLYHIPNLNISDEGQRREYFSRPGLAKFRLELGQIVKDGTFGTFPDAYRESFYYDLNPYMVQTGPSSVAYIFSKQPSIFTYENGAPREHPITDLTPNEFPPAVADSISDFSYVRYFGLFSEMYLKLLYDPRSELYVLFQARALQQPTAQGSSDFEDKPFTIYLIDKSYRVVGKRDFPAIGHFLINKAAVYDHTLYIPSVNGDAHNPEVEYHVFRF